MVVSPTCPSPSPDCPLAVRTYRAHPGLDIRDLLHGEAVRPLQVHAHLLRQPAKSTQEPRNLPREAQCGERGGAVRRTCRAYGISKA